MVSGGGEGDFDDALMALDLWDLELDLAMVVAEFLSGRLDRSKILLGTGVMYGTYDGHEYIWSIGYVGNGS